MCYELNKNCFDFVSMDIHVSSPGKAQSNMPKSKYPSWRPSGQYMTTTNLCTQRSGMCGRKLSQQRVQQVWQRLLDQSSFQSGLLLVWMSAILRNAWIHAVFFTADQQLHRPKAMEGWVKEWIEVHRFALSVTDAIFMITLHGGDVFVEWEKRPPTSIYLIFQQHTTRDRVMKGFFQRAKVPFIEKPFVLWNVFTKPATVSPVCYEPCILIDGHRWEN